MVKTVKVQSILRTVSPQGVSCQNCHRIVIGGDGREIELYIQDTDGNVQTVKLNICVQCLWPSETEVKMKPKRKRSKKHASKPTRRRTSK